MSAEKHHSLFFLAYFTASGNDFRRIFSYKFTVNLKALLKEEILPFFLYLLALLLGITLGSLLFRHLPDIPLLSNPYEIVSPLSRLNYDPSNNTLRFVLFMLCPAGFWIALEYLFRKIVWQKNPTTDSAQFRRFPLWPLTKAFLVVFGASYLIHTLLPNTSLLDGYYFFHEGEWLAPAYKWYSTGQLWTGSFFAHGGFYDGLAAGLSWKFFGIVSLGAERIGTTFLEKIIFVFAAINIVTICGYGLNVKQDNQAKAAFAALAITTYFILTYQTWHTFERRDLFVLIGFPLLLKALIERKGLFLYLAALMACASWVYSIDRGAYFSCALLFILFAVAILTRDWNRLLKELGIVALGIFTSLILFLLFLGKDELVAAIDSTRILFQIKDLSDGNKYPPPGFPIVNLKFLLTRHTVPLVNLSILFLSAFILVHKNKFRFRERSPEWITILSITLLSLVYYRGALSRCDEIHFRYVSTYAFLGAALCVTKAFTQSSFWKPNAVKIILILLGIIVPADRAFINFNFLANNLSFFKTYKEFIQKPDKDFLFDWEIEALSFLEKEFKDEPCLYSMVSEPLWPYLLRKNSCSKFHLMWLISDKRLQQRALDEFSKYMPNKILMHTPRSGDEMDGILIEDRVKYLYAFIREHYRPHAEFKGWEVWKKN